MHYPVPENEAERVAVVESYQITDTPPELSYDDIAEHLKANRDQR